MSNFKLPNMEHSFQISVNGNDTGTTYTGDFTYKRPTVGDRSRIDVMNKRLNGDLLTLEPETVQFNEAVAYLRFTLTKFPDFWKDSNMGMDLYDSNVVVEVYNKCSKFEEEYLSKVHSKDGEGIEGDAQTPELAEPLG